MSNHSDDDVQVVPLSFFTRAHTDMTTGGEFLRRLEWFLDQYHAGKVVMADTAKPACQQETDSDLNCPLGKWSDSPPGTSAYSGRIISQKYASRIDRCDQGKRQDGQED